MAPAGAHLPDRTPAVGRERLAQARAALGDHRVAIESRPAPVLEAGPAAVVGVGWTARGIRPNGAAPVLSGSVMSITYRGTDGGWRVLAPKSLHPYVSALTAGGHRPLRGGPATLHMIR